MILNSLLVPDLLKVMSILQPIVLATVICYSIPWARRNLTSYLRGGEEISLDLIANLVEIKDRAVMAARLSIVYTVPKRESRRVSSQKSSTPLHIATNPSAVTMAEPNQSAMADNREISNIEHASAPSPDTIHGEGNTEARTGLVCSTCRKPQSDQNEELKRCSRCLTARYCSRECQKRDWKIHKHTCAAPGTAPGPSQPETWRPSPEFEAADFMFGLTSNDYLRHLPEKEAFSNIIDCFRLRVEDEHVFRGQVIGHYNGGDPLPDFQHFLRLAESRAGLLPPWWNEDKRKECERMAMDRDNWNDINCAAGKHDIIEHYEDSTKPFKLRLLAEMVYGRGMM